MPALESVETLNLSENKIEREAEIGKLSPFLNLTQWNCLLCPLADEKGDDFKREALIALDMLNLKEINEDEVTEDDRTDAKNEKEERIKAAKEAEEEAARLAAEKAEEGVEGEPVEDDD